jgi:hypothetical protein
MVRSPKDTMTGDLLSWQPPQVTVGYAPEVTGRAGLHGKIARVVAQALRNARDNGFDRKAIADELTIYLGRNVSLATLDKYVSEGNADRPIPLDVFIGIIHVTGEEDLMGFIPALFGHVVVDKKYAEVIELTLLREHRAEIDERERALLSSVRRAK